MAASLILHAAMAVLVPLAGALIKIELKNGRTIDVDVEQDQVVAIYFEDAKPPAEGEVITLVSDKAPRATTQILEKGKWYTIEASGTFSYWKGKKGGVDAVWCHAQWRCGRKGRVWNSLRIDERGLSDIAGKNITYNPLHVYTVRYKGRGKALELLITKNHSDCSGNLKITIKPD